MSTRWLANPSRGCRCFPHHSWRSYEYLIHCQTEDSCAHWMVMYTLPIMLTIEPRMVTIFWACSPISFRHKSFWSLFLEPHLTTYPSNIGVWLRYVTKFGISTLWFKPAPLTPDNSLVILWAKDCIIQQKMNKLLCFKHIPRLQQARSWGLKIFYRNLAKKPSDAGECRRLTDSLVKWRRHQIRCSSLNIHILALGPCCFFTCWPISKIWLGLTIRARYVNINGESRTSRWECVTISRMSIKPLRW